jgi:hypothetical protein
MNDVAHWDSLQSTSSPESVDVLAEDDSPVNLREELSLKYLPVPQVFDFSLGSLSDPLGEPKRLVGMWSSSACTSSSTELLLSEDTLLST